MVGVNAYQKLPPLKNAVPEAGAIAGLFQAVPLLDSAATKQRVKAGAPAAAYIHLSCHGSFNWRAPMDSALYLANDEPLTLSEIISDLDLRSARLVTLSACETGISDVNQSPDEFFGLPAGFLQAGARGAGQQPMDRRRPEHGPCLWSASTANHLERGMTFPAALREARNCGFAVPQGGNWAIDCTRSFSV